MKITAIESIRIKGAHVSKDHTVETDPVTAAHLIKAGLAAAFQPAQNPPTQKKRPAAEKAPAAVKKK